MSLLSLTYNGKNLLYFSFRHTGNWENQLNVSNLKTFTNDRSPIMCHRHYCLLLLQPLIQILPLLTTELLGQLLCKQEQSLHGLKQTGVTCTVTVCKQKYFLIKGCQFIVNPFNVLYYNIGKNEFEKVGFRKHSLFIMRKKQTNKQKASLRMCSTNCNSNNLNFLSEEIFPSLQYFQITFDCTE